MTQEDLNYTVAGIDIGGNRKGCNLVVLRGTSIISSIRSKSPEELAQKCIEHDVVAVGIDSPCQWRGEDGARSAERQLALAGVSSFSTPTRQTALDSTSGFYDWIFNGERVYQSLASTHPLLETTGYSTGRVSFETFPHAITCAMLGMDIASAKEKRTQRRALLERAGVGTDQLTSIDAVDAALCALTARWLVEGTAHPYGDAASGYIWVPSAIKVRQRSSMSANELRGKNMAATRVSHFSHLAEYNHWMNTKLYNAAAKLSEEQLNQDRGAFFGSIFGTLSHIVVGDLIWLKRISSHSSGFGSLRCLDDFPMPTALSQRLGSDLSALESLRATLDEAIIRFCSEVLPKQLEEAFEYTSMSGTKGRKLLGHFLLHFFNHQTHHRGQASTLFSQFGVDIGPTDFILRLPDAP